MFFFYKHMDFVIYEIGSLGSERTIRVKITLKILKNIYHNWNLM